jgi:hypothetical protein
MPLSRRFTNHQNNCKGLRQYRSVLINPQHRKNIAMGKVLKESRVRCSTMHMHDEAQLLLVALL